MLQAGLRLGCVLLPDWLRAASAIVALALLDALMPPAPPPANVAADLSRSLQSDEA